MSWVFDDQAIIDRYDGEEKPVRVFRNFRYWWRNTRALTLAVDNACMRVFGLRAWGWRLVNVCLHLVNTALVSAVFGWPVAGLFFVHPVSGGLSVYISARADLLMTGAALGSAWCFREGGLWWLGAVGLVWVARSAKSCGVLAAAVLWLTVWCLPWRT